MRRIAIALLGLLALLILLWLVADLRALLPAGVFAARGATVQYSGILAMGCMSAVMILALRQDFANHGLPVADRFHQEMFAMR